MNPLIDGLVNSFRDSNELGGLPPDDAFELFAGSLVLGDQLVTQVELTDLLLDKHTIAVDIAVLEINGQLVWDVFDVNDVCEGAGQVEVVVRVLQAKRSEHINSADVLALGEATKLFLRNEELNGSPKLASLAEALQHMFSAYAHKLKAPPSVDISFVTTARPPRRHPPRRLPGAPGTVPRPLPAAEEPARQGMDQRATRHHRDQHITTNHASSLMFHSV